MSQVNVWVALRDDTHAEAESILEARFGEDPPLVPNRAGEAFASMQDRVVIQGLYRLDDFASRDWTLYSLYFDPDAVMLEIAHLRAEYPAGVKVLGGWEWDGTALPAFPQDIRLLEFLPDIVTYDIDGTELTRDRPTVATDINLRAGQTVRSFA